MTTTQAAAKLLTLRSQPVRVDAVRAARFGLVACGPDGEYDLVTGRYLPVFGPAEESFGRLER